MLVGRGQCGLSVMDGATALVVHGAEVSEAERPGNLLGLGHLIGVPEGPYARCELRRSGSQALVLSAQVKVLYPPTGHRGEALLRFYDIQPEPPASRRRSRLAVPRLLVLLVRRGCGGSGVGELPDTLYPTRA
jgi:hypothetical protein